MLLGGPYTRYITIRHYQLSIRELFAKPKKVLPALFKQLLYSVSADIETIRKYAGFILDIYGGSVITPRDIFCHETLLASVMSGDWEKFNWIYDNYKAVYEKKEWHIFTNAECLKFFIISIINIIDNSKGNVYSEFSNSCDNSRNNTITIKRDEKYKILDFLLFNIPGIQHLGIKKDDYKEIYLSAVSAKNFGLARRILTELIPSKEIQFGTNILQSSLLEGIIVADRDFIDFIIKVDAANGEWVGQYLAHNFRELTNIISKWYKSNMLSQDDNDLGIKYIDLLNWYLQKYFKKYRLPGLKKEELGLLCDFTIDVAGYLTPHIWQALYKYFGLGNEKINSQYATGATHRILSALGMSNLLMAKILLAEYLEMLGKINSKDWIINVPGNILINICGNKMNGPTNNNLAILKWMWSCRQNIITDWQLIYSSARSWICKYYNTTTDNSTILIELIKWVWDTICIPGGTTLEFARNLAEYNFNLEILYRQTNTDIVELIIQNHPQFIPKIWGLSSDNYNIYICQFLLTRYPDIICQLPFQYESYIRGMFNNPNFSCWMMEAFPNFACRIDANIIMKLISQQYGFYLTNKGYLPRLLMLLPIDGDICQRRHYIFHYANQAKLYDSEWSAVLYKICLLEPDKYEVILDPVCPNNLSLAHFNIGSTNMAKYVSQIELCPICQAVDSTIITGCGHQFCEQCINKWLGGNQEKNCPYCRCPEPVLFRAVMN